MGVIKNTVAAILVCIIGAGALLMLAPLVTPASPHPFYDFIEQSSAPALSSSGQGRLYADNLTHVLLYSANGGAYGALGTPVPQFQLGFGTHGSGPVNVSTSLTSPSGAVGTLIQDCDARDFSVTTLVCDTGGSWARVGASGLTTGESAPFTESLSRSADYDGVPGSAAPDTTTLNVGTNDYVILLSVFDRAQGAKQHLLNKWDGSTGNDIHTTATNVVKWQVNATTLSTGYTLTASGRWMNIVAVCRADGTADSARLYADIPGVKDSGVCSATTKSNSATATIGRLSDSATEQMDGRFTFSRAWTFPQGTIGTNAQIDTLASHLLWDLEGFKAEHAVAGFEYPDSGFATLRATDEFCPIVRISTGTNDLIDNNNAMRLFDIGWPCMGTFRDNTRGSSNFGGDTETGYIGWNAGSGNFAKDSTNQSTASYTTPTAGDRTVGNSADTPANLAAGGNNIYEATIFEGGQDLTGANQHCVHTTTGNLSASPHGISVFVGYDGNQVTSSRFVAINDATIGPTATAWYDVEAGIVANVGAGVHVLSPAVMKGGSSTSASARAEFYGFPDHEPNIYYTRIFVMADATAAGHDIAICATDSATVLTKTVANTNDRLFLLWGVQVEALPEGFGPSPLIRTGTSVPVTRGNDELCYDGANIPNNGGFTVAVRELLPRSTTPHIGNINQSGFTYDMIKDSNNRCYIKNNPNNTVMGLSGPSLIQTTGQNPYMQCLNAGVNEVDCCSNNPPGQGYRAGVNTTDGQHHFFCANVFESTGAAVYVDDDTISGITDTTVDLPDFSSGFHLCVGWDPISDLLHGGGPIADVAVWPQNVQCADSGILMSGGG